MIKIQLKLFLHSCIKKALKDINSNLKLLEIFTFDLTSSDSSSIFSDLYFVPLTGAYLVPYLILLLIIGIPLFFLELAVGQRIRRGSIGVWNYISPKLGGIGFASCVVSFFNIVSFAFRCYDIDFLLCCRKRPLIDSWASRSVYSVFKDLRAWIDPLKLLLYMCLLSQSTCILTFFWN